MTTEELKARCLALATVGDAQAEATLNALAYWETREKTLLAEVRRLEKICENSAGRAELEAEVKRLRSQEANFRYIIEGIKQKVNLAEAILIPDNKPVAAAAKQAVSMDEFAKAPGFGSVLPTVPGPILAFGAGGKLFDINQGDHGLTPEEKAIEHTRRLNGLQPKSPEEVYQSNTANAAGHYDKTDKMKDAAGNKGET